MSDKVAGKSKEELKKALESDYPLIPMKEITDEARIIAVAWMECDDKNWIGQKHKLASDIMNYARRYASQQRGCGRRIKASERLPGEDGFYVYWNTYSGRETKGIVAFNSESKSFICKGNSHVLKFIDRVEWLDETPCEVGEENRRLREALEKIRDLKEFGFASTVYKEMKSIATAALSSVSDGKQKEEGRESGESNQI